MFLIEQLEPFAANMSSSSSPAQQEIESLRAQLEAEKAHNSKNAEPQQPSKHRRLHEKQEAPLHFVMQEDLVDRAINPEKLVIECCSIRHWATPSRILQLGSSA